MSYATKLKYAGNAPFKPEDDRLPYPVFEALTQTEPAYEKLAQVRYLVDELESDMAGDDAVPGVVEKTLFGVVDGDESIHVAVDQFVAAWLRDNKAWLISEWGIDADVVAEGVRSTTYWENRRKWLLPRPSSVLEVEVVAEDLFFWTLSVATSPVNRKSCEECTNGCDFGKEETSEYRSKRP